MKARLAAALAVSAGLVVSVGAPVAAFDSGMLVTFAVGDAPVGIAFDPVTGDRAYIAASADNTLVAVGIPAIGVSVDIPVGSAPMGVALSTDGTVAYVPSYGDNLVTVIDTTTDTVTGTIPVGTSPFFIAMSPDGTKAYVPNSGDDTVSVISTATNTVTATMPTASLPVAVAFSPDGSTAYVAQAGGDVMIFNVATSTFAGTIALTGMPYGVGVSEDGTRLYVSQYSAGTVTVFNTADYSVAGVVTVGGAAEGVGIRPGGRQVFVAHGSGEVAVIDTATLTVIDQLGVGALPRITAFSPDGSLALVSNTGEHTATMIELDFTVAFDSAGGSAVSPQDISPGALAAEPPAPTRAGYAFDGWWNGATEWDFATDTVTSEVDLVAHWLPLPTITGNASESTQAGNLFTWTPTIVAQPGYTVTSTALPSGLTIDSGTGIISGIPTVAAGPATVTVTVTDANGSVQRDVTITVGHAAAQSLSISASDLTPRQGDTITITTTAMDSYGNTWDASSTAVINSSVASDQISVDKVKFIHASPHVLTVTVAPAIGTITVQVSPAGGLGITGSEIPWVVIGLAALLLLVGGLLVGLRARRARSAGYSSN
ncbi:MAG TPA: InlB B-repeat-containing protein [Pseudolysinimonas sp.]|nr:InlB B-repeat-containing protein [Pseudolysinimonas sp.]